MKTIGFVIVFYKKKHFYIIATTTSWQKQEKMYHTKKEKHKKYIRFELCVFPFCEWRMRGPKENLALSMHLITLIYVCTK